MEGRNRKLNRWQGYDYSQSGLYFITICTHKRIEWFGRVANGEMILNQHGRIINDCWFDLPNHYANCALDEFVVMPNHIHGIIVIDDDRRRERSVTVPPAVRPVFNRMKQSPDGDNINPPGADRNDLETGNGLKPFPTRLHGLSEIIRGLKTFSSKYINKIQSQFITDKFQWQKSFHDRVIRNDDELYRIRQYIYYNPINWPTDRNNI